MIVVNGTPHTMPDHPTVSELLRTLGIDPDMPGIAVAVDSEIAARGAWSTLQVADGSRIEIVTATQGG